MTINVNGKTHEIAVDPGVELLTVLRNYLDLTGSKYGCGEGTCGGLYGADQWHTHAFVYHTR